MLVHIGAPRGLGFSSESHCLCWQHGSGLMGCGCCATPLPRSCGVAAAYAPCMHYPPPPPVPWCTRAGPAYRREAYEQALMLREDTIAQLAMRQTRAEQPKPVCGHVWGRVLLSDCLKCRPCVQTPFCRAPFCGNGWSQSNLIRAVILLCFTRLNSGEDCPGSVHV